MAIFQQLCVVCVGYFILLIVFIFVNGAPVSQYSNPLTAPIGTPYYYPSSRYYSSASSSTPSSSRSPYSSTSNTALLSLPSVSATPDATGSLSTSSYGETSSYPNWRSINAEYGSTGTNNSGRTYAPTTYFIPSASSATNSYISERNTNPSLQFLNNREPTGSTSSENHNTYSRSGYSRSSGGSTYLRRDGFMSVSENLPFFSSSTNPEISAHSRGSSLSGNRSMSNYYTPNEVSTSSGSSGTVNAAAGSNTAPQLVLGRITDETPIPLFSDSRVNYSGSTYNSLETPSYHSVVDDFNGESNTSFLISNSSGNGSTRSSISGGVEVSNIYRTGNISSSRTGNSIVGASDTRGSTNPSESSSSSSSSITGSLVAGVDVSSTSRLGSSRRGAYGLINETSTTTVTPNSTAHNTLNRSYYNSDFIYSNRTPQFTYRPSSTTTRPPAFTTTTFRSPVTTMTSRPTYTMTTTSPPNDTIELPQYPANDPYDDPDPSQFPDSPYHNYAYYTDPFSSTYSTHSYYENYGSEFTNRYYHDERVPPRLTYLDYQKRREQLLASRIEPENTEEVGVLKIAPRQNGLIPTNLISRRY